jgi:hypothetical protein
MDFDRAQTEMQRSALLLSDLLKEVSAEESLLSGGLKVRPGTEALEMLNRTRIQFGNPSDQLLRLTPGLFERSGIRLTDAQKKQISGTHSFYYLCLKVALVPARGVQFSRLECRLDLGPKGASEPLVQSVFPASKWRDILAIGGSFQLGIDAHLNVAAESKDAAGIVIPGVSGLSAGAKAAATARTQVGVNEFLYHFGTSEIVATGEGNSECFWRIAKPEMLEHQTIPFTITFKVPKGQHYLELAGVVSGQPHSAWMLMSLGDVVDGLSAKLKDLLRRLAQTTDSTILPIGDCERWTLQLPQA